MSSEKDYSEYKFTEYDRYRMRRNNRQGIDLDIFDNRVRFDSDNRTIEILVDPSHERKFIEDLIPEYFADIEKRTGIEMHEEPLSPEEYAEKTRQAQDRLAKMKEKYRIKRVANFEDLTGIPEEEISKDDFEAPIRYPMNDVLSETLVELQYGEGLLDFVYSDLVTPMKKTYMMLRKLRKYMEGIKEKRASQELPEKEQKEKIYNRTQEIMDQYYDFALTCDIMEDALYASLYSAVFPPCFDAPFEDGDKKLERYADYLLTLQKEYQDLLEFCYDEDFYPEVLGGLYPSERYMVYRNIHDLPISFTRREELLLSHHFSGKIDKMPFGMPDEEYYTRVRHALTGKLNDAEKVFAQKYGFSEVELAAMIHHPTFMSIQYDVSTAAEMLELEFTKMLEENIRFRKCKRCGKYFIMKGNYDTNYCDRIAEGSTRTCQELAAIDNYKAKAAGDPALPLYSKYYKRYAARVKTKQIKEEAFKKWKYQALTKRDECSDGKISMTEYEAWLEESFPNRKIRNKG